MKAFQELRHMRHFSPDEFAKFEEFVEIQEFPKGTLVCEEGQPSGRVYVIRTGEAAVVRRERILSILRVGDVFSEEALLANHVCTGSVVVRSDISVYSMTTEAFERFLTQFPLAASRFLLELLGELTARLHHTASLLGTISDVGKAISTQAPLKELLDAALRHMLRDVQTATGAALYLWNEIDMTFEPLCTIGLRVSCDDCAAASSSPSPVYLKQDAGVTVGVRIGDDTMVLGALFLSKDSGRMAFSKEEEVILETVAQQLMLAIHTNQDLREMAAMNRLKSRRFWGL